LAKTAGFSFAVGNDRSNNEDEEIEEGDDDDDGEPIALTAALSPFPHFPRTPITMAAAAAPDSVHRVTMGGPQTAQSLQNINRMMRLPAAGGKENPTVPSPSSASPGGNTSSGMCHCKKSRCIKLYCECFATQRMCTTRCKCANCLNTVQHERERDQAMIDARQRKKSAFAVALDRSPTPGCKCRRSECLKKYCEVRVYSKVYWMDDE
jgi:hypothetical protein